MIWWMKLDHLLTHRRLTYAWIAGGVLWVAWLLSLLFGPGNFDMAGQVVGTDYLQFYSAGLTLLERHSPDLYNFEFQSKLEQSIAGPGLASFHAFLTPPFLAWLYAPFALLPYAWSFIIWSLLGLLLLWASIKFVYAERPTKTLLWSLTWFPIFAAISFGQNSLLSLFLFSLTYWLWKREKNFAAGLVSSLILFKPQLALGLGFLWLLEWRKSWKSMLGLAIGGGILAGLCFWLLPEASRSYIDLARNFLPGMIYQEQFPLLHMHSLRGFWALLLHGNRRLTEGLSIVLSVLGAIVYYFYWRRNRARPDLLFAGAICLTIWVTPHAMIYDWSILIIPAILFWKYLPDKKSLLKTQYALIWVATFLSGPLVLAQLKILPVAVQISVPILFFVYFTIYQNMKQSGIDDGYLEMA